MEKETYTVEQLAEYLQRHLKENEHKTGFKIYSPYIIPTENKEYGYIYLIEGYIDTDYENIKDNRCGLAIIQTRRKVTVTFGYLKPDNENDNLYEYPIFRELFEDASNKIEQYLLEYITDNNIAKEILDTNS